jgi:hypothetical protein
MRRRGGPGLVPLGAAVPGAQAEARIEARLRRSWLLVVGPALEHQTCLLRAHRGTLVVGCWRPDLVPSLRRSAQAVWPQLQERLQRLWKFKFQRLEIVPCDPPEPAPAPAAVAAPRPGDPLLAVLERLRAQRKEP